MDREIVIIGKEIIQKDFQLADEEVGITFDSLKDLSALLTRVISYLLDKDMNRLLNCFYRVDVDEIKVKNILTISNSENIARDLAQLVLERELIKVKYRLKYKQ